MPFLNSLARANLKRSDYAMPDRRAYPIPDEPSARNALARVNKYGTAEEKKRVKAAIKRKYPEVV